MKRLFFLIFILLSGYLPGKSQTIFKEPLSPRQTYYRIGATLDDSAKIVNGEMSAYWVNLSKELVPDIQLHMYLNAFSSSNSTFYKESGASPGNKESDFGWIDIKKLTDRRGRDLTPFMEYISPDDGNADDRTVLKIRLPQSASPGDTVFLNISFESKLPSRIERTGYNDDYFFVAQWFPKFGVYEPAGMRYSLKGGWNCHQFHANSEFYSNHSVYDVSITLPKKYIVGSGGLLIRETDIDSDNKTLIYRAEDIVDFAWTAWPGYSVVNDKWKDINITFLFPAERKNQVERQFKAVKNALEFFEGRVGPFPWPHLTFVDPPAKGAGSGGMEYTTIFTSSSAFLMPSFLRFPETATIHEFGHSYFMGIMASNEFEEPWLDEGLTSFWEARIVDNYYGANSGMIDLPYFKLADKAIARSSYIGSGSRQVISNNEYSWNYPHGTYGMMSYNKASTWLFTLMGIVGEETTDEIFREYYRKWSFRHPSGKDFINTVNEVVTRLNGDKFGPDMNWFFDQTLYGTGICDYKVSGFTNNRTGKAFGRNMLPDTLSEDFPLNDSLYYSVVNLVRTGEIMLPVEVLIHFNNGEEIMEYWDGKSRYKDFKYEDKPKILWVKIDPEYKITMDVNYVNNSMTDKPDRLPLKIMTNKLVLFLEFMISIIYF